MITQFIEWTTHLSRTSNAAFAFVTVATMAVVGIGLSLVVEIIFKVIGMKADKVEDHY